MSRFKPLPDAPVVPSRQELPNAPDINFGYRQGADPVYGYSLDLPKAPGWTGTYATDPPKAPEPISGRYQMPDSPSVVTKDYTQSLPNAPGVDFQYSPEPPDAPGVPDAASPEAPEPPSPDRFTPEPPPEPPPVARPEQPVPRWERSPLPDGPTRFVSPRL